MSNLLSKEISEARKKLDEIKKKNDLLSKEISEARKKLDEIKEKNDLLSSQIGKLLIKSYESLCKKYGKPYVSRYISIFGSLFNFTYDCPEDLKNEFYTDEIKDLDEKNKRIVNQMFECIDLLICLEHGKPQMTDSVIDLRINFDSLRADCVICLHNELKLIGYISYSSYTGNIAYEINENYRGHGYAYSALCLLSEFLYNKGINFFTIFANERNTPSVKTILKYVNTYGGELIERDNPSEISYRCDTIKSNNKLNSIGTK